MKSDEREDEGRLDTIHNSSTAMKDLKVVMDKEMQSMTVLGDNPFRVMKKPIEQVSFVSNQESKTQTRINSETAAIASGKK